MLWGAAWILWRVAWVSRKKFKFWPFIRTCVRPLRKEKPTIKFGQCTDHKETTYNSLMYQDASLQYLGVSGILHWTRAETIRHKLSVFRHLKISRGRKMKNSYLDRFQVLSCPWDIPRHPERRRTTNFPPRGGDAAMNTRTSHLTRTTTTTRRRRRTTASSLSSTGRTPLALQNCCGSSSCWCRG